MSQSTHHDVELENMTVSSTSIPETLSLHRRANQTTILDQETNHELGDQLEDEFPEGGKDANLVVLASFIGLLIDFGIMNSVGVVQAFVNNHQLETTSSSTVGWIFSIYFFMAYGGSLFTGPFFDSKGDKFSMIIGSILMVVGLFTTANCTQVYQFILSFGIVFGLGSSFIMTATLGAVSHWFQKKRSTALGICTMSGSLGGILWPLMFRCLFPKIGFKWSLNILGGISLILLLICTLLLKMRLPKTKPNLKESIVIKDLFIEPRFLTLSIAILLGEFSLILVITYMPSYTIYHGYSEADAFLVTIACNSIGVIGRVLAGYLGDKFGRFNIMWFAVTMCSILILSIWLPFGSDLKIMYSYSIIFGFFSSSFQSLTPVCCGQISKTRDFGKRYGTVYFLVSFGNLIALPLGGALIGDGKGYNNLIIFAGVIEGLSAIFWGLSRYFALGCKWNLKKF